MADNPDNRLHLRNLICAEKYKSQQPKKEFLNLVLNPLYSRY